MTGSAPLRRASEAAGGRGFTLIEVMAVMALLGILLFFIPPNLDSFGDRSRLESAANSVSSLLTAAREIATNSPLAVWMTKETMWQTVDSPSLRHAIDIENRTQIMCTATGDITEAFAAFRDRRQPEWSPL